MSQEIKTKRKRIGRRLPIDQLIYNKLMQLNSSPREVTAKYKQLMFNIEMRGSHLLQIQ